MGGKTSMDEILDFAIQREQEAADFYTELAARAVSTVMKNTFQEFAGEERRHRARLMAVREGRTLVRTGTAVQDLRIGDYLVDQETTPDMDYQSALILAMKREKAAFKLYSDLADSADDLEMTNLFLGLAREEARHKLRFEVEYDEAILGDN